MYIYIYICIYIYIYVMHVQISKYIKNKKTYFGFFQTFKDSIFFFSFLSNFFFCNFSQEVICVFLLYMTFSSGKRLKMKV